MIYIQDVGLLPDVTNFPSRKAIDDYIEALIEGLDDVCYDDERETDVDFEPILGAVESHPHAPTDLAFDGRPVANVEPIRIRDGSQLHWALSQTEPWLDDCEVENEHGGDINDEPHDDDREEF